MSCKGYFYLFLVLAKKAIYSTKNKEYIKKIGNYKKKNDELYSRGGWLTCEPVGQAGVHRHVHMVSTPKPSAHADAAHQQPEPTATKLVFGSSQLAYLRRSFTRRALHLRPRLAPRNQIRRNYGSLQD